MPEKKIKCAETGIEIGPGTGIDIYKYTVAVFNLPDIGKEQLLKLYGSQTTEFAKRVIANLTQKGE